MKLFISYSRDDKAWVYELWRALRDETHHDAWIDQRLLPAQDWWTSILENIENCECFIYVLSPLSVESIYCRAEVFYALALGKPILPVMLKPCNMPSQLSDARIQYLSLNDKMSLTKVLLEIERGLGKVALEIERGNYPKKEAKRPSEPKPQSKQEQAKETFLLAEDSFEEGNPSLAEKLWRDVITSDPQGWGVAAKERLDEMIRERECGGDYATIVEMINKGRIKAAQAAWNMYLTKCGADYDPEGVGDYLAQQLSLNPMTVAKPETPVPHAMTILEHENPAPNAVERAKQSERPNSAESRPIIQEKVKAAPKLPNIKLEPNFLILAFIGILVFTGGYFAWSSGIFFAPVARTLQANEVDEALTVAQNFDGMANDDWQPVSYTFADDVPMVLVPAGCFEMGDNGTGGRQCFDAFWIDQTEVTQADFQRLGGTKAEDNRYTGDNRPVENITWFEARDYCRNQNKRLPTEAEWEYAARGLDALLFPWGNEWNEDNAVWNRIVAEGTAEVGSIPADVSWVGALDMSGNVREWTRSVYADYPYNADDGREDDRGESADIRYTLRGGSWYFNNTLDLRPSTRNRNFPNLRSNYFGFRCVLSYNSSGS